MVGLELRLSEAQLTLVCAGKAGSSLLVMALLDTCQVVSQG